MSAFEYVSGLQGKKSMIYQRIIKHERTMVCGRTSTRLVSLIYAQQGLSDHPGVAKWTLDLCLSQAGKVFRSAGL
jgi:hypothetical protein